MYSTACNMLKCLMENLITKPQDLFVYLFLKFLNLVNYVVLEALMTCALIFIY